MNTLGKTERLDRKKVIGKMFEGRGNSFSVFPMRVVYMPMDDSLDAPAAILVSVSKRRFKQAVKRNRVKRQIREAYRKQKHLLVDVLAAKGLHMAIAFIYLSDELVASSVIEAQMKVALSRMVEQV